MLVQRRAIANAWNGAYLGGAAVPDDLWGARHVCKSSGKTATYDLSAVGPDEQHINHILRAGGASK